MAWKKGESGNPLGSKPDKPFLEALNRAIKAEDGKRLRAAAEKVLTLAAGGEQWAVHFLADRTDGKPVQQQQIDQTTTLSGAIEVSDRPKLSKEEWLKLHGLGTAAGAAE